MLDDDAFPTLVILACDPLQRDETEENRERSFGLAYIVYERATEKTLASSETRIIQPSVIPEKAEGLQRSCVSADSKSSEAREEERLSLESWLHQLEVDVGADPAIVVTYGPSALREYVHPCAQAEKVNLPEALHSYVDIELASRLNIDLGSEKPQGLEFCRILLEVMQQMPPEGAVQMIQSQYSPAPSSTLLQEDTIVRVQGLTPNTSDFKLARFFAGLNIESGGIVWRMPTANGRPPGEALVRFTNKEQRDLALKRNGMKFGTRSIEISKASVQEYSRELNQDQQSRLPQALHNFLELAASASVIVRMRGLPYNTKASEIVTFFGEESPVHHEQQGILFVYHPDGRPTGDAFVLFENTEHGKVALSKHRQTIGKRYVELFQMSKHEVIQVFARHSLSNNLISLTAVRGMRPPGVEPLNLLQSNAYLSNVRNIIRLRGLPYSASVQDILDFLGDFAKYVTLAGVHMVYNFQSRPTGDAFIEMKSADHAQKAAESLHKKHIGERYIEVFQCSSSDMTLMLMNGISQHRNHTWINTPYSPRTPPHVPSAFTYPSVSSTAYPAVSSPNVPHSTNSPLAIISVPSSPTVNPRVYMTSPGYMSYPSQSYNVFNFSYPAGSVPVDGSMAPTPPGVISPASYDNSAVFFPNHSYQVPNDYPLTQVDHVYVPMNPYVAPTNGYYPSTADTQPDPSHFPPYVETYSG